MAEDRIRRRLMTRWGILVVSVVFVGIGLYRGEQIEVFNKAIRICLECMGIG